MGNIRLTQFAIAIALGGLYFISLAPAQGKSQDGKIARLMTIGIGQEKVCGLVLHFESGTLFFSGPFSFLKHMRS